MQHRSQTSAHRLLVRLERVLSLGSSNKKREEFYYKTQYNFVSQGKRDEIPELNAGFHSGNKHQIGPDFSPSCVIHTAGQKKVKNTSTVCHPGCGSQIQTGTENWCRKPMRGFNFVPILSNPMLIFLSGNRPFS